MRFTAVARSYGSVEERSVHTGKVAGSNPARTTTCTASPEGWCGFFLPGRLWPGCGPTPDRWGLIGPFISSGSSGTRRAAMVDDHALHWAPSAQAANAYGAAVPDTPQSWQPFLWLRGRSAPRWTSRAAVAAALTRGWPAGTAPGASLGRGLMTRASQRPAMRGFCDPLEGARCAYFLLRHVKFAIFAPG